MVEKKSYITLLQCFCIFQDSQKALSKIKKPDSKHDWTWGETRPEKEIFFMVFLNRKPFFQNKTSVVKAETREKVPITNSTLLQTTGKSRQTHSNTDRKGRLGHAKSAVALNPPNSAPPELKTTRTLGLTTSAKLMRRAASWKAKSKERLLQKHERRERRATKTLAIVLGIVFFSLFTSSCQK